MALKVVHINKLTIEQEKAAKELWENVLKPKWEARNKAKAEKLFAEWKANPAAFLPDKMKPKKKG